MVRRSWSWGALVAASLLWTGGCGFMSADSRARLAELATRYSHAQIQLLTAGGRLKISAAEFSAIHAKTPMVCDSILYSSHDDNREGDVRLDQFKAASVSYNRRSSKHKGCYFLINVDIPWNHTAEPIANIPNAVREQWRRRSPNNPLVLVDRYKAALLLFGLIASGRIVTSAVAATIPRQTTSGAPGNAADRRTFLTSHPWVMYLDGDAIWVDKTRDFESAILSKVRVADRQPTLEQVACGPKNDGGIVPCASWWDYGTLQNDLPLLNFTATEPDGFLTENESRELWRSYRERLGAPNPLYTIRSRRRSNTNQSPPGISKYAFVLSHSDCIYPSVHVHSGVFVTQISVLAAWILDSLASSVEQVVDVRGFVMGDQAVWDLFTEQLFDIRWRYRLEPFCRNKNKFSIFSTPCRGEVFTMSRQFRPNPRAGTGGLYGDPAQTSVLQARQGKWFSGSKPSIPPGEPDTVALVCPKWFNAPVCRSRYYRFGHVSNPFAFHCGDPVWHMYGCAKSEWNGSRITAHMNSPTCRALIPLPYPKGSPNPETNRWATTDYSEGATWNDVLDVYPLAGTPVVPPPRPIRGGRSSRVELVTESALVSPGSEFQPIPGVDRPRPALAAEGEGGGAEADGGEGQDEAGKGEEEAGPAREAALAGAPGLGESADPGAEDALVADGGAPPDPERRLNGDAPPEAGGRARDEVVGGREGVPTARRARPASAVFALHHHDVIRTGELGAEGGPHIDRRSLRYVGARESATPDSTAGFEAVLL